MAVVPEANPLSKTRSDSWLIVVIPTQLLLFSMQLCVYRKPREDADDIIEALHPSDEKNGKQKGRSIIKYTHVMRKISPSLHY